MFDLRTYRLINVSTQPHAGFHMMFCMHDIACPVTNWVYSIGRHLLLLALIRCRLETILTIHPLDINNTIIRYHHVRGYFCRSDCKCLVNHACFQRGCYGVTYCICSDRIKLNHHRARGLRQFPTLDIRKALAGFTN